MNEAEDILSMLGGQSSADILQLMAEDDDLDDPYGDLEQPERESEDQAVFIRERRGAL